VACLAHAVSSVTATAIPAAPVVAKLDLPGVAPMLDQKVLDSMNAAITAGDIRTDFNFDKPADEQAFEDLIRANETAGYISISDSDAFIAYWKQNKASILADIPTMGSNLTWQTMLAIVYLKYKIIKTDAKSDPTEFLKWLHG